MPFRGAHVVMQYADATLLGEVVRVNKFPTGERTLTVRYFNGEPWPTEPMESDVTVLERAE